MEDLYDAQLTGRLHELEEELALPDAADNAPYFDAVEQDWGVGDDRVYAPPPRTADKRREQ